MGFAPRGNSCKWSERRSPLSHSLVLGDWRNEMNQHLMASTNPADVWWSGILPYESYSSARHTDIFHWSFCTSLPWIIDLWSRWPCHWVLLWQLVGFSVLYLKIVRAYNFVYLPCPQINIHYTAARLQCQKIIKIQLCIKQGFVDESLIVWSVAC